MQFNDTKSSVAAQTRTTNHAGGEAFDPTSVELSLAKVVINNLLEDAYYESDEERFESVEREFDACASENPEFVLKTALYARQEEGLRQVPQALLVLAANDDRTSEYVREYAPGVMARADEPLDVLALHVSRHGTSIPDELRLGIEDALHQYDAYQYAKWDIPGREWRYRDLLNLIHPTPRNDEIDEIFERIAYGELDGRDIKPLRETEMWQEKKSAATREGSEEDGWDIENMGLKGRVLDTRNMVEDGLSGDDIFGDVTDEWIRNSRLYPFRFYQAYKALNQTQGAHIEAKEFLEHAIDVSAENIPDLGNTAVFADISGSMQSNLSMQSEMTHMEIATLFASILYGRGADVGAFASRAHWFGEDQRNPLVTNMNALQELPVGGMTHGYRAIQLLDEEYDRVIMLTDMQVYGSSLRDAWDDYRQSVDNDPQLYCIDLNAYGDLTVEEPRQDVHNIQGWSSKVFDYIDASGESMVESIESVEP